MYKYVYFDAYVNRRVRMWTGSNLSAKLSEFVFERNVTFLWTSMNLPFHNQATITFFEAWAFTWKPVTLWQHSWISWGKRERERNGERGANTARLHQRQVKIKQKIVFKTGNWNASPAPFTNWWVWRQKKYKPFGCLQDQKTREASGTGMSCVSLAT